MSSQIAAILFTDQVGSTELRARIGDDHADRLRRLHDRLSCTAVETHGGVVVKGLGDGMLAGFGEASGALAAAVAIQQAADAHTTRHPDLPLVLRVALSAGDVTIDEGDWFGTPVVEAARLCAAAEGGQILAAEVIRLLVKGRGGHEFRAVGELKLKGLPEPVAAIEVAWARADETAVLPFPRLLSMDGGLRFTGRGSEFERLQALWKQAAAAERASVLISGEPGVGKTRLAAEAASAVHRSGAGVLYGRCQEALGVPYEPFVEALTFFAEQTEPGELRARLGRYPGELVRLLPDLADLVPGLDPPLRSDPETEQYRLFQAVTSWLVAAAETSGLCLVIDDLHWAPLPTLRLLGHLLRGTSTARLLVIATFRDTEAGSDGAVLGSLLADLRRIPGTERLALHGLTLDDLTELLGVDMAAGLAATLHRETQGNPFFVGEILRHQAESGVDLGSMTVPEGVRDVIASRVARLAPTTGEILTVAAVLGADIELTTVATVAAVEVEPAIAAFDQGVAARLVEETGPGAYRFVHALVRATLDAGVTATRKARLHLRAADSFPGDPVRTANHLIAAAPLADPIRTAKACLGAGDRALAVLADAEAGDWFARGLPFFGEDWALRVDLLTGLGEAQRRTGEGDFRQTLFDAARLAARHADTSRLVRAVVANSRGFTSAIGEVDEERLELIAAALNLVGPSPSAERADLLSLKALELIFTGDHHRVLQAADEAATIVAEIPDLIIRARVGVRRVFVCQVPDRAVAVAAEASTLLALVDETGDPQLRVLARRPAAPHAVGALVEARRRMSEARAIAEDSGQPALRARATFDYAGSLDALGDHEEAARLSQLAVELGQQAAWIAAPTVYAGRMAVHWSYEGQLDIMTTVSAQAARSGKMVSARALWALGLALTGRHEELAQLLGELNHTLGQIPVDHFWLTNHFLFTVAMGFGTADEALAGNLYERLLPYRSLHASLGVAYWGPIEVALAVGAREQGRLDTALAHHEAAAATIDTCGAARPRALNGYHWARTLLRRGGPGDGELATKIAEETLAYSRAKGYATFVTKTEELLADIT